MRILKDVRVNCWWQVHVLLNLNARYLMSVLCKQVLYFSTEPFTGNFKSSPSEKERKENRNPLKIPILPPESLGWNLDFLGLEYNWSCRAKWRWTKWRHKNPTKILALVLVKYLCLKQYFAHSKAFLLFINFEALSFTLYIANKFFCMPVVTQICATRHWAYHVNWLRWKHVHKSHFAGPKDDYLEILFMTAL